MTSHANLVPFYKRLRQVGTQLNHKLIKTLSKETLHEGGRRLGILHRDTLVFDSEDAVSVLMDYCIYNVYSGGQNAVQRYLAESPLLADSDEMIVLRASQAAYYAILQVTDAEPGVGVAVRDALRGSTGFMVDVGFGSSAQPGWLLAGRVVPLDDFLMSGGASLPVNSKAKAQIANELKRSGGVTDFSRLTPGQEGDLAATVIRCCLNSGASSQIRYQTIGGTASRGNGFRSEPQRIRANRNDRCPCGSGRKYKTCCGKRAAPTV